MYRHLKLCAKPWQRKQVTILNLWQRICTELCFQAITIPEDLGGMGLGFVELAAVLEQMGRVLLCSPFFSTVCFGVNSLLLAGTDAQKNDYLPKIVEGTLTATLAYTGKQAAHGGGEWGADAVQATYKKTGNDYVLNGTCVMSLMVTRQIY